MATCNIRIYFKLYFLNNKMIVFVLEKKSVHKREQWDDESTPTFIHDTFYGIVLALSVHQLAAQGEMLYLATRIEQGNSLFYKVYLKQI